MSNKINWAFFGTDEFSTMILDGLKDSGYIPKLVITTEDKTKGRKMLLTPPEVKIWANKYDIKCLQFKSLRSAEVQDQIKNECKDFDLFIVASYGIIIPQTVLDIPKFKTLNVHPSLLPKLRGPSPIQSSILSENETGVSIMRLDSEMDHGPILTQKKLDIEWPPYADELEEISASVGVKLLSEVIPGWISGKIKEIEQDHSLATFCKMIEKKDAELDLSAPADLNLRKIRAYAIWPGAYFFEQTGDKQIRIIVKKAKLNEGELLIERIVPEGKKEMDYNDYLRGKRG